MRTIEARRYRCLACNTTTTVAPRGVLTERRYTAFAIVLAIALWSVARIASREVRAELSPVPFASFSHTAWPTLRGWIDAAATLFPRVRSSPREWACRQRGAHIASTIRAFAPPTVRGSLRGELFAGAPIAALAR